MSPQGRKVSLEHTPVQQLAFSPLPNNRLITLSVVVVTYVKRSPVNRPRSPRSCLVPRHPLTAALSIYGPTALLQGVSWPRSDLLTTTSPPSTHDSPHPAPSIISALFGFSRSCPAVSLLRAHKQ